MMKDVKVVIGMNYGDEGKGHLVDYLVDKTEGEVAVVRFNSGAQAAHTVEFDDIRHVFHHLGSGTFAGAPTILSRFFVVNPVLFFKELSYSPFRSLDTKVYADPRCLVTTPYDVILNREREKARDDHKHGSCGIGFGETIQRDELGFTLRLGDLHDRPDLHDRMRRIRDEYFWPEMEKLDADMGESHIDLQEAEERFTLDALDFIKYVTLSEDTFVIEHYDHLVFEGAQGLRLDQYSSDFPHVTRSSTGLENVSVLLSEIDANINVYYLTRSYLTRHGAGPLEGEVKDPGIIDATNIHNDHQGTQRFAQHNFKRMCDDVERDKSYLTDSKTAQSAEHDITYTAVITCCDQWSQFIHMSDFFQMYEIADTYVRILDAVGTTKLITSWGPKRSDIKEH